MITLIEKEAYRRTVSFSKFQAEELLEIVEDARKAIVIHGAENAFETEENLRRLAASLQPGEIYLNWRELDYLRDKANYLYNVSNAKAVEGLRFHATRKRSMKDLLSKIEAALEKIYLELDRRPDFSNLTKEQRLAINTYLGGRIKGISQCAKEELEKSKDAGLRSFVVGHYIAHLSSNELKWKYQRFARWFNDKDNKHTFPIMVKIHCDKFIKESVSLNIPRSTAFEAVETWFEMYKVNREFVKGLMSIFAAIDNKHPIYLKYRRLFPVVW